MNQPPVHFTYRLLSYLVSAIIAGQPLLPAVGAVITPQNGAGMDKAANGVPVVNIATPNGAGISHNRFTDYNVGKEGLILNNATAKLNPTQLGGLIQNNPNLKAGGEAKGIINEVTGGNRSLLQGYTEVAGKAANVMVANPYGITCDGCGFINTPHATLTTGRPVMNADGSLQALEVTEGSITINGAGLDGTRSDAVSIIARATEVNAALHAKDLTVTAGANRITADGRVSALKGEGDVPKVAVDNRGTVQGNHVTIRQNSVTNSGTLTGIAALTLAARMVSPQPALMNNGGSLLTSGDLTITAGSITSSGHWQGKRVLITADSLANSGAIQAADSLTARLTGELVSAAGSKVTSNGEMALSALNLSNSGQWIAKNLTLKANSLTSAGDITGVDALTLTVNQTLNNHASGKLLSAGVLTLKADSVTNDGQLQGNATTITAGQLTNGGHLQGETLTLAASGGVNNRSGGVLMSRNALNVSTATLSNQGTIQGGGGVSLNATDRLQNDGKILSGSNLTLTAQVLANTGSGLVQAATLLLDVVNTVNGGRVLATGSADVKGTTLNNTGTLQGADLLVNYHTFSNSGTLLGTSGLGVKGSSLLQNGTGRLYSAGNLLLDAQDFSGQGQVVATGDVTLKLIAALTNHGTGDSVVVDPGHDRRTVDEKFEQKKSGLTVALSGTVGSAINNAVTSAQETKESSDSRLKVLQATKTALSGVQAGQAAAMATATGDPNATGVSLSLTTQKSKSQQHSESDTVSGSTLNAGNNLSVVATGKNRGDNRGDIVIAGSQLKAGGNTSLDAANDVLLSGAANTQKTTGRNSSSGGGVGVSIGAGGNGAGISVFASVNAAKGSEKGNGTEWTETTIDSGKTVTINSGRDTVLNGAQVNGNRIIADVGHDLLISSQQDSNKYDSKQNSVAAGGSFTFGSMTGSGYIAASRDKMKSRFDSVAEQTGMFAGDG
ncbi:filamentous hemagglutinin N-terminal domain-containing protein, partial [Escherichia coli]|nr:filamentous hemagglutinin N-terminal domain-containing protein [Escherichia coli]